jgi:chemotaxis protein methyltransferase CheR
VGELSDHEFALFQALIQREAGIFLSPVKKPLLVGRLGRRVRDLGLPSFGAYYRRLKEDPQERIDMLDRVSTNKTHFFREPAQFTFLEHQALPALAAAARGRRLRAWSAGCSSGEEAYSLAAVLLAHLPPEARCEVEIVGTDISTRVLERARAAVWPLAKSLEVPQAYLRAFFLKGHGSQEGLMKAGPALRHAVHFERRNLVEPDQAPPGPFDLIFCRNVLIYFDAATKAQVLESLLGRLAPEGYLFLGHAESLQGLTRRAASVGPTVYRRLPAGLEEA